MRPGDQMDATERRLCVPEVHGYEKNRCEFAPGVAIRSTCTPHSRRW